MSPEFALERFLSSHSHRSWTLDSFMVMLAYNEYLKGAVLMLFWWAWNARKVDRAKTHKILLATLPAPFVAFFVGRALAHLFPFRVRPISVAALHWRWAEGMPTDVVRHWSSMPSDHAACYAAAAFSIFLVSRRLGLLAFIYTLLVIDLPRIYLGLHYPSDVGVGILVGIAVAAVLASNPVRNWISTPLFRIRHYNTGLFYSGIFLTLFTVACIDSVHDITVSATTTVQAWAHHLGHGTQAGLAGAERPVPVAHRTDDPWLVTNASTRN